MAKILRPQHPLPERREGCTDAGACNYSPEATTDNGTCEYTSCLGCMDNTACNFDPTATINDAAACIAPGSTGSACDDGDPFTFNDVIDETGCTCAGTPIVAADGTGPCAGANTLTYDGHDYTLVEIGEQCWFAENLQADNYNNGATIPHKPEDADWAAMTVGAQVAVNGDEALVADHGRLYNSFAVQDGRGLCPTDWHVASDADWTTLVDGFEDLIRRSRSEIHSERLARLERIKCRRLLRFAVRQPLRERRVRQLRHAARGGQPTSAATTTATGTTVCLRRTQPNATRRHPTQRLNRTLCDGLIRLTTEPKKAPRKGCFFVAFFFSWGHWPTLAEHPEGSLFPANRSDSWARWPDDAESNSKTKEACGTAPRTPAALIIWPASPTNLKSPVRATAFMWRPTFGSLNAANWTTSARASSGRLSPTKTVLRSCASSTSTTSSAAASTPPPLLPSIARCCWRALTSVCRLSMRRRDGSRVSQSQHPYLPLYGLAEGFSGGYGAVGGVF